MSPQTPKTKLRFGRTHHESLVKSLKPDYETIALSKPFHLSQVFYKCDEEAAVPVVNCMSGYEVGAIFTYSYQEHDT